MFLLLNISFHKDNVTESNGWKASIAMSKIDITWKIQNIENRNFAGEGRLNIQGKLQKDQIFDSFTFSQCNFNPKVNINLTAVKQMRQQ